MLKIFKPQTFMYIIYIYIQIVFATQRIIGNLSTIVENSGNSIWESLSLKSSLFSQFVEALRNSIFTVSLQELSLIPEFFLAFTAVTIITHCSLIGYSKKYNNILLKFSVTSLCMLILFLTLVLYFHEGAIAIKYLSLEFSFVINSLGFFSKIITIIVSLVCMYLIQDYIIEYRINSTEYDLLMLYAILGLTMLIAANDFGTIFLALELFSLALYYLSTVLKKGLAYSVENSVKYFLLGAHCAASFLLGGYSNFFLLLFFSLLITVGFYFSFTAFLKVLKEKNYLQYIVYFAAWVAVCCSSPNSTFCDFEDWNGYTIEDSALWEVEFDSESAQEEYGFFQKGILITLEDVIVFLDWRFKNREARVREAQEVVKVVFHHRGYNPPIDKWETDLDFSPPRGRSIEWYDDILSKASRLERLRKAQIIIDMLPYVDKLLQYSLNREDETNKDEYQLHQKYGALREALIGIAHTLIFNDDASYVDKSVFAAKREFLEKYPPADPETVKKVIEILTQVGKSKSGT